MLEDDDVKWCGTVPGWDTAGCCTSCHEDWEAGYGEPMEHEYMGVVYHVCCAVRFPDEQEQTTAAP